jgi:hypothetical protein
MSDDKKFRHPAGVRIKKGMDATRYRRSDEGKKEVAARKEHNEKFGPTDQKTKRALKKDRLTSDAAKGKKMRDRGVYYYSEEDTRDYGAVMKARGGTFKGTF